MGIGKENKEMNIAYLHDQMKQYNEQHNPHAELNVALRTKLKAMQNIEADLRSEISQLNERLVAKQVSEKDRSDWQAATEQIINKQQENFDYIVILLDHLYDTIIRGRHVDESHQKAEQYSAAPPVIIEEQNEKKLLEQGKEFRVEMDENKDSEQVAHSDTDEKIDQQAAEIDTLKKQLTKMEEQVTAKEEESEATVSADDQHELKADERFKRRFTFRDIQQAQEVYSVPGKNQTTTYRKISPQPIIKEEKPSEQPENKTQEEIKPSIKISTETDEDERIEPPREASHVMRQGNHQDRKSFLKSIWDKMK
ncbi:MAG TPA: hypothetical protein VK044_09570 [Virgibacillus sp.]|nr:hypothetical protein [Virgibacillus sp.]